MRNERKIICLAFVAALLGIWWLISGVALAGENQSPYEPSTACASCHADIHGMWANGMHAQAYGDPIFRASFLQAFFETEGKATAYCLRCHDPTSRIPEDFDVKRDIIGAGVTCDFCHTVQDIDLGHRDAPLNSQPGVRKTGPYLNSHSPAHDTEQKDFFKKSELCAGCHHLTGENGVVLIGTYREWKESSYAAEDVQCQDCHMPIEPEKKIVSEDVKRSKRKVNLHNLAGGHSIDQIRSAIKVEIKNVVQEDDSLFVTVHVTNVNSGHKIPTGTPSRQLILRVSVRDRSGRFYLESDKVFEKVLMDENKQILRTDHEIMLKASRVYYDNRIGPKEVREVPFSFSIPYPNLIKDWKRKLTVEAKTLYQFLPQVIGPQPMIVEVAGDIYPRK